MNSGDEPSAHQLRLLLTLAEELHFGRAGARLYLSQPALSQQIRALEQRIGTKLFTRTSRRVELTTAGRALLPLAHKVVDAADEFRAAARRANPGVDRLRLGVCESFATLPATHKVIDTVFELYPDLGPDVHVVDFFIAQLTALEDGIIDAAFVYLPVPGDLDSLPLTNEPRLACVSSSDPLAERSSVLLADLADRPMVSLAPKTFPAARNFWAAEPRPNGVNVRYTGHQVATFESLLSAVSLSQAIAFVPASATQLYARPGIRYLPVADLPECTFSVVWKAVDRNKPKIVALERTCRRLRDEGRPAASVTAAVTGR
jgi:DNA-binding transcriptional LysR family regulator